MIINPLGAALKHYTASLERLLADCDVEASSIELAEPSAPGQSRSKWLIEYCKVLGRDIRRRVRQEDNVIVIQTWPLIGYFDYLLSRLLVGRSLPLIIFHDPHPLVKAMGYGRVVRWTASRAIVGATAIVHSKVALEAINESVDLGEIIELDHPMFPPEKPPAERAGSQVVRVLGQYKSDRNLQCMEQIAKHGQHDWRFEVIGRGWPSVPGWQVTDRFVEEHEFEHLIRSSSVILIPYVRFFQSGVAIRSLELGTPVVGPRASSLADLVGRQSPWLVDGESWDQAVASAIGADAESIYLVASRAYEDARERWLQWIETLAC